MSRIEALVWTDHSVNCILSKTSRIKTKLPAHLEHQTSARFTSLGTFKRDKPIFTNRKAVKLVV